MSFFRMLKCCLNYKVIIGVGVVIALIYFFAPNLAQYSWILLVLICPLSMILMMVMMNRKDAERSADTSIREEKVKDARNI